MAREPLSGRTISGAVTDRSDFPKLKQMVSEYVARSHADATGKQSCVVPRDQGKKDTVGR